jgi:membrane-associated phospholipid phosphatase
VRYKVVPLRRKLQDIVLKNSFFYILFAGYAFIGLFILLFLNKGDLVLLLNHNWTPFLDYFFRFTTYLGDGLVCVAACALILIFDRKNFLLMTVPLVISSLVVQLLKRQVFAYQRPFAVLPSSDYHFVTGVEIHSSYSFPSGHTTAAFVLYFMLSYLYAKTPLQQITLFIVAIVVAASRMYLFLHFFEDTYAGAWIAIIFCTFTILLVERTKQKDL